MPQFTSKKQSRILHKPTTRRQKIEKADIDKFIVIKQREDIRKQYEQRRSY